MGNLRDELFGGAEIRQPRPLSDNAMLKIRAELDQSRAAVRAQLKREGRSVREPAGWPEFEAEHASESPIT
jgi:hypothetical protein